MKPAPAKPPRRKGKPLAHMKQATVETIVLALAMELRDDWTICRMRLDNVIELLKKNANIVD